MFPLRAPAANSVHPQLPPNPVHLVFPCKPCIFHLVEMQVLFFFDFKWNHHHHPIHEIWLYLVPNSLGNEPHAFFSPSMTKYSDATKTMNHLNPAKKTKHTPRIQTKPASIWSMDWIWHEQSPLSHHQYEYPIFHLNIPLNTPSIGKQRIPKLLLRTLMRRPRRTPRVRRRRGYIPNA